MTDVFRQRSIRKWVVQDFRVQRLLLSDGAMGDYASFLIAQGGRPMERALIRARQRYEKQKPANIRASAMHRAYSRKRRGWKPA